jgi:cytochrome o ubiquinol oxidase subunit IV
MNRAAVDSSGAGRGSYTSYAVGFILSIILTVIPFAVVMNGALSGTTALSLIFAAAILQILLHLHFFLHLDTSSAMRWNVLALILALLIMILFVWGTLWIMGHLNYRLA